ncbi:hypothetical protein SAMN04488093_101224 [Tropicibacter naphthalenivorans]|uniref:Bulb-type lectin domain-containing protein n=2 Tax=Tropicibacter naphthalenivorans TaxID=441103 RepID=A0A0P1G224_9RHOB|nr:hypothetical protein TRN7648_00660 [Tropicibacter naphthalenivorans]SMC41800.1 hypothetical protein SAMN04488093_101224 [Tropicibacter naphthalenivorans]
MYSDFETPTPENMLYEAVMLPNKNLVVRKPGGDVVWGMYQTIADPVINGHIASYAFQDGQLVLKNHDDEPIWKTPDQPNRTEATLDITYWGGLQITKPNPDAATDPTAPKRIVLWDSQGILEYEPDPKKIQAFITPNHRPPARWTDEWFYQKLQDNKESCLEVTDVQDDRDWHNNKDSRNFPIKAELLDKLPEDVLT